MILRSCGGTLGGLALLAVLGLGTSGCGPRSTSPTVLKVEGGSDNDVRYGDQEALGAPPKLAAQTADGEYLEAVAEAIQPAWSSFLEDCRLRLPPTHELNAASLEMSVVLVLSREGAVLDVRSAKSSGNEEYDQVALEIVGDLGSLPAPPTSRLSDDDRVYLQWLFARDTRQAGPATASWKHVELPLAQALPKLLAASQFTTAATRVMKSGSTPAEATGFYTQISRAMVGTGLAETEPRLQVIALHAVSHGGGKAYLPNVRTAARSTEPAVAVAAIEALAAIGEESDKELLSSFAHGASGVGGEVSAAAAAASLRLGSGTDVAQQAVADLTGNDDAARRAALAVLAVLSAPESVAPLSAIMLSDRKEARDDRVAAATALGRQASESSKAAKALLAGTEKGDASVRSACTGALAVAAKAGLRNRLAYWRVLELLKDRDERVRAAAILAAAALDPGRFAKELKSVRAAGSKLVLTSLAEALAMIPGSVSLGRLLDLSTVPSEGMRIWAARGLAGRKEAKAQQALARLRSDESPKVRVAAMRGLIDVPQLTELLGDVSPNVQAMAFAALTKIQGRETTSSRLGISLSRPKLAAATRLLWIDAWLGSGE
ncbi:MAG: hypothetical protein GY811_05440 [Myxococcales bacterium]|nr:hypothetical protein [Myxococcales bacterium]